MKKVYVVWWEPADACCGWPPNGRTFEMKDDAEIHQRRMRQLLGEGEYVVRLREAGAVAYWEAVFTPR